MVPTVVRAGVATNVVPMHSEVTFDMRLLPGDEGDTATEHVLRALRGAGARVVGGDGERIPGTMSFVEVMREELVALKARLAAADGGPSELMKVRAGSAAALCPG